MLKNAFAVCLLMALVLAYAAPCRSARARAVPVAIPRR